MSTAAVAQLLRDRDIALELDLPERPPVVRADRDRVVQVLVNLLSNAGKFTAPGTGVVRVATGVQDGLAWTSVTDNGPGIPAAEQAAVFEKFHQSGSSTDRPAGTGLGLPISREIVRRSGGTLELRSAPGEGATFTFTLPLVQDPRTAPLAAARTPGTAEEEDGWPTRS